MRGNRIKISIQPLLRFIRRSSWHPKPADPISIQPLLRFILANNPTMKEATADFNTTLVKVHRHIHLIGEYLQADFNTTLVKVHRNLKRRWRDSHRISIQPLLRFIALQVYTPSPCGDFNTTLVKVHPGVNVASPFTLRDFNTTLVKVHQWIHGGESLRRFSFQYNPC